MTCDDEAVGPPIDSGDAAPTDTHGLALHSKIMIGLMIGAILGISAHLLTTAHPAAHAQVLWLAQYCTDPVGQVFLYLLFIGGMPLVFASLALGVAKLGDLRTLSRIGAKVGAYFLLVTALAVTIGLALAHTLQPGVGFEPAVQARLLATFGRVEPETPTRATPAPGARSTPLVNLVQHHPIDAAGTIGLLAVICFALLFGVALRHIPVEQSTPVQRLLDGLHEVIIKIVDIAMQMAPVAIAALMFSTTARFGWGVLRHLFWYALCVITGLLIQQFAVFALLVRVFAGLHPLAFFRSITPVMVTAFATSSSQATLPTTMKTAKEALGVPPQIASFVLPLGATMNMSGTALFAGATCVFLAQVFGVHLGSSEQLIVILFSVLIAVGTAGVPGSSIPLLMIVLNTIGVPPGGIAIVLSIDRLLDMCRTVPNVTGAITCACFIARSEGAPLMARRVPTRGAD
jgi:dicarboxylate/amino acid:cation (Na+ or H+) symporter, DAACS family